MINKKNKKYNTSKLDESISFLKSFKRIFDRLNEMELNNSFIELMNKEYENTLLYMNKEKK